MMNPFGGVAQVLEPQFLRCTLTQFHLLFIREAFSMNWAYILKLIRNQDDEFNYRCRSKGYKILMHPEQNKYFVEKT